MSNNYFNFKIPFFNTEYGVDWTNLQTIVNDNVDYLMGKTYQLYWLDDPNYYSTRVTEKVSDSLFLLYNHITETSVKKFNIRKFLTTFANKGLKDTYLDIQENIVGIRGDVYARSVIGWKHHTTTTDNPNRWGSTGSTFAGAFRWSVAPPQFEILIDVMTLDNGLLDQIEEQYRRPELLPAFYTIYLVDSSFTFLRRI